MFIDYETYEHRRGCCSKPTKVFENDVASIAPHKGLSQMIVRHFPEGKDSIGFNVPGKKLIN
jgi:hypothetical protein